MTAAVLVMVGMLGAACGVEVESAGGGGGGGQTGPGGSRAGGGVKPPSTAPPAAEEPMEPQDVCTVADDVQAYWDETFPELYGEPYEPVEEDRIVAADSSTQLPVCQGEEAGYEEVQGNAFAAPCPEGILVAWDAEELIPSLDERFGPVAAAVVLAHEWGHVAQYQAGVQGPDAVEEPPTVFTEQQADCFAGAWLADTLEDPEELDRLIRADPFNAALEGILEVRDPVGTSASDESAHGSGFDRVRALQEGYDEGPEHCAGYIESPPTLTEIEFTTPEDEATGGNLPLDELVPLVVDDLNLFFGETVEGFEGKPAEEVQNDEETVNLLTAYSEDIGDSGAGLVMALIWSGLAQEQTGSDEGRDEQGQLLQAACLSGGWLASVFNNEATDERPLTLSPGDLDEAVLATIDIGRSGSEEEGDPGSAEGDYVFELVAALRQGVIEGFESCGLGR